MSSRIEQIIEEIEEFIDSCKFQPLSSTKIVVNKEELEELLRELRMKTPDEMSSSFFGLPSSLMQVALQQSNQLIEQTNAQAQEIMDKATEDSNNIRMSAIRYTDEMLDNLEKIMSHTIDAAGSKYNNFINSIQSCYDIVSKNRSELAPQAAPSSYTTAPSEEGQPEEE